MEGTEIHGLPHSAVCVCHLREAIARESAEMHDVVKAGRTAHCVFDIFERRLHDSSKFGNSFVCNDLSKSCLLLLGWQTQGSAGEREQAGQRTYLKNWIRTTCRNSSPETGQKFESHFTDSDAMHIINTTAEGF